MLAEVVPTIVLFPCLAMIIIGIPVLICNGGAVSALEIMSSMGNILSYARLMAIGTASVLLAMVANRRGGLNGSSHCRDHHCGSVTYPQYYLCHVQPLHTRDTASFRGILFKVL
jgi:hypothetical protein